MPRCTQALQRRGTVRAVRRADQYRSQIGTVGPTCLLPPARSSIRFVTGKEQSFPGTGSGEICTGRGKVCMFFSQDGGAAQPLSLALPQCEYGLNMIFRWCPGPTRHFQKWSHAVRILSSAYGRYIGQLQQQDLQSAAGTAGHCTVFQSSR